MKRLFVFIILLALLPATVQARLVLRATAGVINVRGAIPDPEAERMESITAVGHGEIEIGHLDHQQGWLVGITSYETTLSLPFLGRVWEMRQNTLYFVTQHYLAVATPGTPRPFLEGGGSINQQKYAVLVWEDDIMTRKINKYKGGFILGAGFEVTNKWLIRGRYCWVEKQGKIDGSSISAVVGLTL